MRSKVFRISTEADVQIVLNGIHHFCVTAGGGETVVQECSTIGSELAYNLVKYAPGGSLSISIDGSNRLLLRSEDSGAGLESGAITCMQEGYTSGSSLGLGLPSIVRLSDDFRMENSCSGTIISAWKILS